MKNFGLDVRKEILEISEEDYVLGGFGPTLKCIAQIPTEERIKYLPEGEKQHNSNFDTMDCASRAVLNILEAKLNYMFDKGLFNPEVKEWFVDNMYFYNGQCELSDRYIAVLSNTDPNRGNSLKAPCQAVHSFGVIPKYVLPFTPEMTQEEYYSREKAEKWMYLGKEFLSKISIGYERVMIKDIGEDMVDTGGFAWPDFQDGKYMRTDIPPNHAFIIVKKEEVYYAFDNYTDFDGDFMKPLAEDYKFLDYGYHVKITGQGTGQGIKKSSPFINFLREIMR